MASRATAPIAAMTPSAMGKIVMAAFFREIGRGQIDGDALRRQGQPNGVQRPAHALAALGHRLVGEADNSEGGNTRADLDLDIHGAGLDAFKGNRGDPREHTKTPVSAAFTLAKTAAQPVIA
jgi:hypothetical protein